jgi:hypothetical protein
MHSTVAKQGLVGVAGGELNAEKHQVRRVAINAVNGHYVV